MKTISVKDKHLKLDQVKVDKVKEIFRAVTEREAIERALDLIIAEDDIDALLKAIRGRGTIKKIFK